MPTTDEAARTLAKRIAWSHVRVPLMAVGESTLPSGVPPPGDPSLHLLAWVRRGRLRCGGTSARAGEALLAPTGATVLADGAAALVHARFHIALGGALDPLADVALPVVVPVRGSAERARWRDLAEAGATPAPARMWARVRARGILIDLVGTLLLRALSERRASLRSPGPDWLRDALDAVERRLHEPRLDVATLARVARLSPSHFAHRFRAAVGLAPKAFLRQRRLEAARTLLENRPDLDVKQVARACGFADPDRFARAFRAATGDPPSRWRATG